MESRIGSHPAARWLQRLSLAAPLHPILVHFTIALTGASLSFDVLGRVAGSRSLGAAGWWALAGSAVMTVFTLATGVVSRRKLPMAEGEARSFLRLHMALGPMFFGLLVIATLWRAFAWQRGATPSWWYVAFMALTSAVMTMQGYLGGELVYQYGAEVEGSYRGLHEHGRTSPRPVQRRTRE